MLLCYVFIIRKDFEILATFIRRGRMLKSENCRNYIGKANSISTFGQKSLNILLDDSERQIF